MSCCIFLTVYCDLSAAIMLSKWQSKSVFWMKRLFEVIDKKYYENNIAIYNNEVSTKPMMTYFHLY